MGRRGIRVALAAAVAVLVLAASVMPAAAASKRATVTFTACVSSGGEFVERVTWSRLHADGYAWFTYGGTSGSGGVGGPLEHPTSFGTLQAVSPAGTDWNVYVLAVKATLTWRDATVWTQRIDRPAGGWPAC